MVLSQSKPPKEKKFVHLESNRKEIVKMAKVKSPLWGVDAEGKVGDSIVFSKWRGVKYARRYAVASNPNTVEQQKTRSTFAWLNDLYRYADYLFRAPWQEKIKGQPLTERNVFVKANLANLRGEANIANLVVSTVVNGGLAPDDATITSGTGSVSITLSAPELPEGWSIDRAVFVLIDNQSPSGSFSGFLETAYDQASPYQKTWSGLSPGQYYVAGYFVYRNASNKVAFGAPVSQIKTVS